MKTTARLSSAAHVANYQDSLLLEAFGGRGPKEEGSFNIYCHLLAVIVRKCDRLSARILFMLCAMYVNVRIMIKLYLFRPEYENYPTNGGMWPLGKVTQIEGLLLMRRTEIISSES